MNKNIETLEKVLLHMADNVYQPVNFPEYISKLEREFAELMAELTDDRFRTMIVHLHNRRIGGIMERQICDQHQKKCKDELADVLCFLIRISNKLEISTKDLLHHALTKMVKRLDDPTYDRM